MSNFTKQRQAIFKDIANSDPGFSCQGKLGMFFDHFLVSEALARKILMFYQDDTDKPRSENIQVHQLIAAQKHFSIPFAETETKKIFLGGTGLRGSKSARQLRNGYIHSLSSPDRIEIESKSIEFSTLLGQFIYSASGIEGGKSKAK